MKLLNFISPIRRLSLGFIISLAALSGLTGCLPSESQLPSTSVPTGPTSTFGLLSATTVSAQKVKLVWSAANDPTTVAYNIYDATMMFNPVLIATVSDPSLTQYTLSGLAADHFYVFRVRKVDYNHKEDDNLRDYAAVPYAGVVSANVIDSQSATINFTPGPNANEIDIFCHTALNPVDTLVAQVTDTSSSSTTITGLTGGTIYTCRAALNFNGFIDDNTQTVTFVPVGTASKLVFTIQPGSSTAGIALPAQPKVLVLDDHNNVVTAGPDATALITLSVDTNTSPTSGSLVGVTSVTAVNGVATFSGLLIKEAGLKILKASKSDTSSQTHGSPALTYNASAVPNPCTTCDSSQFMISPDVVSPTYSSIAISPTAPPSLVADGNAAYSVIITLKDQYQNPVPSIATQFASTISGDTLTQPQPTDATGTATGSIATTIADASRMLSVALPAGLSSLTVNAPFVAGPATKLAFVTQPQPPIQAGVNMSSIAVAVQDRFGNTVLTGSNSTAPITITLNSARATGVSGTPTLNGTTTLNAVNGVATFTDLSISTTGSGFILQANSTPSLGFATGLSNSITVRPGGPAKISLSMANVSYKTILSGDCSQAITLQLQDAGNNPAPSIGTTAVSLSGLGSGALYTSSNCSGTAISSTVSFASGTSTKTYYFKDLHAEAVTVTATDTSGALISGTLALNNSSKNLVLSLVSDTVVAGNCSSAIQITPQGVDGRAGPIFGTYTATLIGILGSSANLYSDAACTQQIVSTSIPLQNNYVTQVYVKDLKSETLTLNLSENSGSLVTTSSLQTLDVLPSKILFAGPSSVMSGACSTAFTVTLQDAMNNSVQAAALTPLTINGLANSTTGSFYTNSSCSSAPVTSTIAIPQGSSVVQLWFKDDAAETLNIYISDPNHSLTNSNTLSIGISPSAFLLTSGNTPAASAKNTVCAGPFTLSTLDGANKVTAAITPIIANLSGAGSAGNFYSDSGCSTTVSAFTFATGDSAKQFYFMGQYPGALTFTAADASGAIPSTTLAFTVTAAPGFIGTGTQAMMDNQGNLLQWFAKGQSMVSSRLDGAQSVRDLHFDSTKQYLYVADMNQGRVLKYDYTNHKYIGWIGQVWGDTNWNNIPGAKPTGSTLTVPSTSDCVGVGSFTTTPGWCVGGFSYQNGTIVTGAMYQPSKIVDDGNYIYVLDRAAKAVLRYKADTGSFAGWIGTIAGTAPVANAGISGLSPSCIGKTNQNTPGWCYGGSNQGTLNNTAGNDGGLYDPRSMVYFQGMLLVGDYGAIKMYNATTGAYVGWAGWVTSTGAGSGAAGCASAPANSVTPGFCTGGTYTNRNMSTQSSPPGGINYPTDMKMVGNKLYLLNTDYNGNIQVWDLGVANGVATGGLAASFMGSLPHLSHDWTSPQSMIYDGTSLYVADYNRIIRVDPTTGTCSAGSCSGTGNSGGTITGWIGKVVGQPTSDAQGSPYYGLLNSVCGALSVNQNTPYWCLGGTAIYGMDEGAFMRLMSIALDSTGNLVTGGRDWYYGSGIQQFSSTTGAYNGTLAYQSGSPSQWSNNAFTKAALEGFDDKGMYNPAGLTSDGTNLYAAEWGGSRIKKINPQTGSVLGWVGAIATAPTGGSAACLSQNGMTSAAGWCLGSLFIPYYSAGSGNILPSTADGTTYQPMGVANDGTYIYVTDYGWHRIQRWKISDGTYQGWIGRVNSTSGLGWGSGCSSTASGSFTPTWCKGGSSQSGSGDGHLANPTGIVYLNGSLYVIDYSNKRVVSYSAATGAFNGWTGAIGTTPTSCSPTGPILANTKAPGSGPFNYNAGYSVTGGWCRGGAATAAPGSDAGGGFNFNQGREGIATDGTYLYIANSTLGRIDKYNTNGQFVAAVNANYSVYTNTWQTNTTQTGANNIAAMYSGNMYVRGLWTDGTYMYFTMDQSYGNNSTPLVKMNLSTGTIIGWKGYILPGSPSANNGDGGTGCTGAQGMVTPGWCQSGWNGYSPYLGGFWKATYITGDSNFIYVSDEATHRISRIPK